MALAKPKRSVLNHSFNPGEEVIGALSQISSQIGTQVTDGWHKLKSRRIFGSTSNLQGHDNEVCCMELVLYGACTVLELKWDAHINS